MNDILALLLLENKRGDCDVKIMLIQQLDFQNTLNISYL